MDLRELMSSPALTVEPPAGLDETVRRRAGTVRRRRRLAAAALGVAGVAAVVPLLPRLTDRTGPGLAAPPAPNYGMRGATSSVVLLERLNEASVVAWFEGDELCTAAIRVKRDRYCAPAVNPQTPLALPLVLSAEHMPRVDDRQVAVGLLREGVAQVRVTLRRGKPLVATVRRGERFPLAVFFVVLPRGGEVRAVEALGADGALLGRHQVAAAAR